MGLAVEFDELLPAGTFDLDSQRQRQAVYIGSVADPPDAWHHAHSKPLSASGASMRANASDSVFRPNPRS